MAKPDISNPDNSNAADLIRQKVMAIYDEEPSAKVEAAEAEGTKAPSKHQKFMQDLVSSGKDMASVQTEWHEYYQALSEKAKLEVWDEFYKSNKNIPRAVVLPPESQVKEASRLKSQVRTVSRQRRIGQAKRATRVERQTKPIKPKVKLQAKHHIQSLVFGLILGFLMVVIFLFGFFNEVIIAPLIQPSRNVSVPVIVGADTVPPTSTPEVIIPKINVEIPVEYNINTTNTNVIENDLEGGVIHFPTTVQPGQLGNAAFFGHSSNNIFNPGKYKFAFVLLHTLVNGDTFYLSYNHTVYVYKVIKHFVVAPSDVAVLGPVSGQQATATLITCDPPGTSINRLIVIGQQISPSISTDTSGSPTLSPSSNASSLPSNGPSLWSRFISSTTTKVVLILLGVAAIVVIFRKTSKKEGY